MPNSLSLVWVSPVDSALSTVGSALTPRSLQLYHRHLGEWSIWLYPALLHPALIPTPGWLASRMITACNPSLWGLTVFSPQQFPNRQNE